MSNEVDGVREVLDRFCRGWEAADAEAVLACFERSHETTVIGTDAGEYWRGFDAFADPFRIMARAFTKARYRWASDPRIGTSGDVAWADGVLETEIVADGVRVAATLRTSWTLRRSGDGWLVVLAHFSVPPPAAVVPY